MKHQVKLGQQDYTVLVFVPDSAQTDGSGKTGLVAANLTVSYARVETDNDVTITDATSSLNDLSALTDAHNDWGLKEVSSSLAPGLYRLDIADAVFASGAWSAVVYVEITTSAASPSPMEFVLVPQAPIDGVLLAPTTHTSAVIPTVSAVTGLTAATVHSDLDDIQARLPAALTGDGNMKVDALRINGSSVAAVNLARSARAIVTGTVGAASTTTSIVTSALSPAAAVADQFKGCVVCFDDTTTTANLRGQRTDITASTNVGVLTVTALTDAPVSGDTFVIV